MVTETQFSVLFSLISSDFIEFCFVFQHMFYDDPRVLYISIHRFDEGTFFPGKHDADHPFVGNGAGKGKSVFIRQCFAF